MLISKPILSMSTLMSMSMRLLKVRKNTEVQSQQMAFTESPSLSNNPNIFATKLIIAEHGDNSDLT